jgi:tight adherence protein C
MTGLYVLAAAALAVVCCACVFSEIETHHRRKIYRQSVSGGNGRNFVGLNGKSGEFLRANAKEIGALNVKIIELLAKETWRISANSKAVSMPGILSKAGGFDEACVKSGMRGYISIEGFCLIRLKMAVLLGVFGMLFGFCFSNLLGIILLLLGFVLGWSAPKHSLNSLVSLRAKELERHLPEMLDVVAIGMRSGLSFDRSLEIYSGRFQTILSGEFASAQRQWKSGLSRRDVALREIAKTYNSDVFSRAIETIIRSLRYGSSMIDGLEAAARDARVSYRTARQEEVAKAPVKMMIPTGVLILPAMLILVLGPVLLELIGGGL